VSLRRLTLSALLLSCCAACQPAAIGKDAGNSGDAASDGIANLPAVHAVLHWENRLSGDNPETKTYYLNMKTCRDVGWTVHELSPQDVAKLGTGRVEIRIDRRQQRITETHWTLGGGDPATTAGICSPRLIEDHRVEEAAPGQGYYLPLESDPDGEKKLQASLGWTFVGEDQVQGQPCKRWRSDKYEVCTWSGGRQWGFSDAPVNMIACLDSSGADYLTEIPLAGKPAGDSGCIVRLESFSLGKGLLPDNLPAASDKGTH